MRIRIVQDNPNDESSYMVQRRYWFFWLVTGGNDHCPGDYGLTYLEAKKIVDDMKARKDRKVVMEVEV